MEAAMIEGSARRASSSSCRLSGPSLAGWRRRCALQADRAADRPRVNGNFLELRGHVGGNLGLIAPAEMGRVEFFHRGDHSEIVDRTGEAVTLVGSDEIFDCLAVVADGGDDLVALADVDARIVLALDNKQRRHYRL